MMFVVGVTPGLGSASAKMAFLGATATDPVLSIPLDPGALVYVLVRTTPTATRPTGRARAPRGGWGPTAPYPARRGNTARTANMTVTARTGQSVIQPLANVIVLPAGVEYFATLGVRRDYSGRTVGRNVTVLMEGPVII